jgi:hypothetical protein
MRDLLDIRAVRIQTYPDSSSPDIRKVPEIHEANVPHCSIPAVGVMLYCRGQEVRKK